MERIGEANATLALTANDTDLAWHDASGKLLKSVPSAVRSGYKAELAAVRKAAADIEAAAAETSALMTHASRIVLGGEPVRTDAKIIRWPERYVEPRGAVLWQEICRLVPGPIGTPTCPQ
jgi:hypothetical protein